MSLDWLLLIHAAATWYLVGLIWMVQIVHYPMMRDIAPTDLPRWARRNVRLTGYAVIPAMLIETATAILLLLNDRMSDQRTLLLVGLALTVLLWVSTLGIQWRQHRRLIAGRREPALERLIVTNWLRTAGWSARGIIALVLILRALQ